MSPSKTKSKAVEETAEEKPSYEIRFSFSDSRKTYEIDLYDLTTVEQIEFEEYFEMPWMRLIAPGGWIESSVKGKVFAAYLARRRREPEYTLGEALEAEATVLDQGDGERPTGDSRNGGSRS